LNANAQAFVNLELGAFYTNINDIRNGNNGTLLSLKNDFNTPVSPFLRLRAGYLLNGKNHFSLLYAPLKIISTIDTLQQQQPVRDAIKPLLFVFNRFSTVRVCTVLWLVVSSAITHQSICMVHLVFFFFAGLYIMSSSNSIRIALFARTRV
jgi:hypothetical protein